MTPDGAAPPDHGPAAGGGRSAPRSRRAPGGGRPGAERRARSVGRHRQDARPGGPLPEPASRRRRARQHPRDHVHPQGRRRDARAHRVAAAGRCGRLAGRGRRDGARCATASTKSRSARSTRSVCRCCASSRWRRISIPASRSPTRPRSRAWSKNRWTTRCRICRRLGTTDRGRRAGLRPARRVPPSRRAGGAARTAPRRGRRAAERFWPRGRGT